MTDEIGPPPGAEPEPPTSDRWLTPGVLGVGAASLFSDSSHEMVTSLLPTFLTPTLGGGPATLGAIDGVADALTGLAKLAGGPLAADPARRARMASGGYLGTAAATALIGLSTAIWQVAILRGLAWASRGIRSPARDMVLTSLSGKDGFGRAFGVERPATTPVRSSARCWPRRWSGSSGSGTPSCCPSSPASWPLSPSPSPPEKPAAP